MEAVVLQDPVSPDHRRLNTNRAEDQVERTRAMDKARLAKVMASANVEAVAIPSAASQQERGRQIRDFVRKAEKAQDGEVLLVIVRS